MMQRQQKKSWKMEIFYGVHFGNFNLVPGAVFLPTCQVLRKATPNGFTEIYLELKEELSLIIYP
jgi:hypothetical protein